MRHQMIQIGRYIIDKESVDRVIAMLSHVLSDELELDKDQCVFVAQRLLVNMINRNEHVELAWILDNKEAVEDWPASTIPIPYAPRA